MSKIEIRATERAQQKYNEISNGSKEEIDKFFRTIQSNGISKKGYQLLFEKEGTRFYYRRCKNVYLIFLIDDISSITVLDFLSKIEFDGLKSRNS